jgi:hypothetical protein
LHTGIPFDGEEVEDRQDNPCGQYDRLVLAVQYTEYTLSDVISVWHTPSHNAKPLAAAIPWSGIAAAIGFKLPSLLSE